MTNPFSRGSAPGRAREVWQRPGSFKPGHRKVGGRHERTRNKITPETRQALLAAATLLGKDGAGTGGAAGYFETLARADPDYFYSQVWIRLLDVEEYEAALGYPRMTEIDSDETAEERSKRQQLAWSYVPPWLAKQVENYMVLARWRPKVFAKMFCAAFLTPPRNWRARVPQRPPSI
jgi:hypothetical protein